MCVPTLRPMTQFNFTIKAKQLGVKTFSSEFLSLQWGQKKCNNTNIYASPVRQVAFQSRLIKNESYNVPG